MKLTLFKSVLARGLPAAGCLALFGSGQPLLAQFTFSIDYRGPTRAVLDSFYGFAISEGDILTPVAGAPAMPIVPGPLPPPEILISAGVGLVPPAGLSIATHFPCIGAGPGLTPCPAIPIGTVEVDALSFGRDGPVTMAAIGAKGQWHFSVDEWALGLPFPTPTIANVMSEGITVSPAIDSAADIFVDAGIFGPLPLPPFGTPPGNTGLIDGNGRRSAGSIMAYPGLGIIEPTAPGALPTPGDNLDAVNVDGAAYPAMTFPVYFSLDSAFLDPRSGLLNTGTAIANGFSGGDVLVVPLAGAPPIPFAPSFLLGLDAVGPDTDDLDALILLENGTGVFEPSVVPFDWLAGGTDMLLFSVREGSAIIGVPDSFFGLPIQAGDILTTPAIAGGPPAIFIACENLGLDPSVLRGGLSPFGDDIDALDYVRAKELLAQEYCFGDGGFFAACTPCPCANSMPAGTQTGCMNSAGTGSRLTASGVACVSADTLEFNITGAAPLSFAVLLAADSRLPIAGLCPPGSGIMTPMSPLDGLRCIGGMLRRHGGRAVDAAGANVSPWGGPGAPAVGLIANGGYIACQTRQWQVFYRDIPWGVCATGVNTTQAIQVTITP